MRFEFGPESIGGACDFRSRTRGIEAFDPSLFDNCIGRKRDVGGVVLASGEFLLAGLA